MVRKFGCKPSVFPPVWESHTNLIGVKKLKMFGAILREYVLTVRVPWKARPPKANRQEKNIKNTTKTQK